MKTRLISVACMLPLLAFLVIGGLPLMIIGMAITAAGLYEFYKGFMNLEIKCSLPVGLAMLLFLYGLYYVSFFVAKDVSFFNTMLPMWFSLGIFICLLMILIDKEHNILGPTYTLIGIIYIAYLFGHIILVERTVHAWAWLPFVISYMSDTGGFFGGRYFGKHKMAPILSPKKTREGAVGGVIFGIIGSIVFALIVARAHILLCAILGLIGSFIAELGDLTASAFKRKMGIKDYSNLIPGHGGVMDRIDSVIFTAPLVYYALILFVI